MLNPWSLILIALAGLTQFAGQNVNPDTYILALPLAADQPVLTVLAFPGGFSAATGMVIVATVALVSALMKAVCYRSTGKPAIRHSGKPSCRRRACQPLRRRRATASKARTQ